MYRLYKLSCIQPKRREVFTEENVHTVSVAKHNMDDEQSRFTEAGTQR